MKMSKLFAYIVILSLLFPFFSSFIDLDHNSQKKQFKEISKAVTNSKTWTILIYMDGDNNLEMEAIYDFLELACYGSDKNINILVQMDRVAGNSPGYGDWTTTKRFYISQGMTPDAHNALLDLGELNMGDPQTLTDFILWSVNLYPADHYAMVLWDHGNGWQSFCTDDSDNDALNLSELDIALSNAGHFFDLIGFDACLMGMAEVHLCLQNWASICVSSENLEPVDGWPYDTIICDLKSNPEISPAELGDLIVNRYYEFYNVYGDQDETLSSINLTNYQQLILEIDEFSEVLIQEFGNIENEIHISRLQCDDSFTYGEYVDLYKFAQQISLNVQNPLIKSKAIIVMELISTSVLSNQVTGSVLELNGIGIYFPMTEFSAEYDNIMFSSLTSWNIFIRMYYNYQVLKDDFYEDNDDQSNAYDLSLRENCWLSSINGMGFQNDPDWYRIRISVGEPKIEIILNHSYETIHLGLFRLDGTEPIIEKTSRTAIKINLILGQGIYYILIDGGYYGNVYDLFWDDHPALDDNYEENNNASTAFDLTPYQGYLYSNQISEYGAAIQNDEDWYKIIQKWYKNRVIIDLKFQHIEGNIDIDVIDSTFNIIVQGCSFNDCEHVEFTTSENSLYYLRVYGENIGNIYELQWYNEKDDVFEDNNKYNTSYNITSYRNMPVNYQDIIENKNGMYGVNGIQWDNDWYEIQIRSGRNRVIVEVKNINEQMLWVYLYNYTDDLVLITSASSPYVGGNTEYGSIYIDHIVDTPGIYYILIQGFNEGCEYILKWNDFTPNDDPYENNDDIEYAFNLTLKEQMWLNYIEDYGVQNDDDWYEISLDESESRLIVKLFLMRYTYNYNYLYIDLYSDEMELLATSSTRSRYSMDWERSYVIDEILPDGKYFLKIYGGNHSDIYNLLWDDLPSNEDNYENNDNKIDAYDLSDNEDIWLEDLEDKGIIYEGDYDWFKVYVNYGEECLIVNLTYCWHIGFLRLYIYNKLGNCIALNDNIDYNKSVQLQVPEGIYYIRIESSGSNVEYNLWWDDVAPIEDHYEDNDNFTTATLLQIKYDYYNKYLSDLNGYGVQNDEDWYQIELKTNLIESNISIKLIYNNSKGDLHMELYNSSQIIVASNYSSVSNKLLDNLLVNSALYLRIFGDNQSILYDIHLILNGYEDFYEKNDNYLNAYNITALEYDYWTNPKIFDCVQNNEDWFVFSINASQEFLSLSYKCYDVMNLIIFDENLTQIYTRTFSNYYFHSYSFVLPSSNVYYILFNSTNMGIQYNFYWESLSLLSLIDDDYENNDSPLNAYPLPRRTWLSQIEGVGISYSYDKDWYSFNIDSNEQYLNLRITPCYDICVSLYNSTLDFVCYVVDYLELELSNGIYYLLIDTIYSGVAYNIWWDDVVNDAPIILKYSPENGHNEIQNSQLLNVTVFDPDGDNLNVYIYDSLNHTLLDSVFNISSGSSFTYIWTNLENNTIYYWFILINDGISQISSEILSFTTFDSSEPPNPALLLFPGDDEMAVNLDPLLCVYVSDPDSSLLNVYFYDASNNHLIDSKIDVSNSSEVSIIWTGLSENTEYKWYVIVQDGSSETHSLIWSFTTIDTSFKSSEFPIYVYGIVLFIIISIIPIFIVMKWKKKKLI